MRYRLLRLLLFVSAFAWAVSVVAVVLPWPTAVTALNGLGAGAVPNDPMLDYWLRMAAGAFTGVGIFFLVLGLWPPRSCSLRVWSCSYTDSDLAFPPSRSTLMPRSACWWEQASGF